MNHLENFKQMLTDAEIKFEEPKIKGKINDMYYDSLIIIDHTSVFYFMDKILVFYDYWE